MNLLMSGGEEERRIDSHSTGLPPIINLPMITLTVCLVGGWSINDDLKWRRTTISFVWEEEWTK